MLIEEPLPNGVVESVVNGVMEGEFSETTTTWLTGKFGVEAGLFETHQSKPKRVL